jgi:hypothetical protein
VKKRLPILLVIGILAAALALVLLNLGDRDSGTANFPGRGTGDGPGEGTIAGASGTAPAMPDASDPGGGEAEPGSGGAPKGPFDGPRDASLRGRVVFGEAREPVAGVLVLLTTGSAELDRVLTGPDGGFEFAVSRRGEWIVCAQPYGRSLLVQRTVEAKGNPPPFLEIEVPDRLVLDIVGTVRDSEGRAFSGVTVRASYGEEGKAKSTGTDADGSYRISGFTAALNRPLPHPPLPDELQVRFWENRNDLHVIHVFFSHPTLDTQEACVDVPRDGARLISLDFRFSCMGVVTGTVRVPHGGSVHGKGIPYTLIDDVSSMTNLSPPVVENRFAIPIERKALLRLGPGLVGDFWLAPVNMGRVNRGQVRKGVVIDLLPVVLHTIQLKDLQGRLLHPERVQPEATLTMEGESTGIDIRIAVGRLQIPLFEGLRAKLSLSGYGFYSCEVEIGRRPPIVVRLDVLPPILSGRMELPAGFEDASQVRLLSEASIDGQPAALGAGVFRPRGSGDFGAWLDVETGEFLIPCFPPRPSGNLTYTVTIAIPDHKSWKMENIPVKRGVEPQRVVVRFEK